ncbi:hypothetical protein [Aquimarina sp. AU474]|uniref:hypothetical protein n=1 Tax=Aquimarina sp. AU474 TaxID=2108529 RepID=UPI000D68B612|nr:hypothetical protein [Aquimarina sp. AU474]
MTSGLRKMHKIIWIMLIVIVPVLIFLSIQSIKQPLLTDSDVLLTSEESGKRAVIDNEHLSISIDEQGSSNTLQLILKKPLKSASSIVYAVSSNQQKRSLLGVLDTKGIYTFELNKLTESITIYDEIKKSDIINIKL